MRLFIIANRLPVKLFYDENKELKFKSSEGGLATGLNSLRTNAEVHWVGWPGMHVSDAKTKNKITQHLEQSHYHPVYLTPKQINRYYEGYSNSILWPLFHYFFSFMEYDIKFWNTYREVNALFAETALKYIEDGDMVWVQDYQLMLVPQMLRDKKSGISIGYFHHVPFPSYELFRLLPERAELLKGLLGADLIGFHTYDYMRHFASAVERVLHYRFDLDNVNLGRRKAYVNAFPMGINYEKFYNAPLLPETQKAFNSLSHTYKNLKLILSVDRLDYSKGILHRVKGFAQFIENHPEYREKVSLLMVTVPSRDKVSRYARLKKQIDEMIGAVNGKYSTVNWMPIYYFYHSVSFEDLVALYYRADVALVTPLRDGMNLVAKEYLAAKRDRPGVLILSEMAGAVIELSDAIVINPNDINQIESSILRALEMPEFEQMRRLHKMQETIEKHNVKQWASDFITELRNTHMQNTEMNAKTIGSQNFNDIKLRYRHAKNRFLIFDYDGTLTRFYKQPEDAFPRQNVLHLLQQLRDDKKNHVLLSSGRDRNTLEKWFGSLNIDMEAEHGAACKRNGQWMERIGDVDWGDELMTILNSYVDKTPGSSLEIKPTALVWHYRNVDEWFGSLREKQLVNSLWGPVSRKGFQIMRGNKIVEIKPSMYSKASGIAESLKQNSYDFILCLGDDVTDEDMFRVLPDDSVTVKVGDVSDIAHYNIPLQEDVLPFLEKLIN